MNKLLQWESKSDLGLDSLKKDRMSPELRLENNEQADQMYQQYKKENVRRASIRQSLKLGASFKLKQQMETKIEKKVKEDTRPKTKTELKLDDMIDNIKMYQTKFAGDRVPFYERQFQNKQRQKIIRESFRVPISDSHDDWAGLGSKQAQKLANMKLLIENIDGQNQQQLASMKTMKTIFDSNRKENPRG